MYSMVEGVIIVGHHMQVRLSNTYLYKETVWKIRFLYECLPRL